MPHACMLITPKYRQVEHGLKLHTSHGRHSNNLGGSRLRHRKKMNKGTDGYTSYSRQMPGRCGMVFHTDTGGQASALLQLVTAVKMAGIKNWNARTKWVNLAYRQTDAVGVERCFPTGPGAQASVCCSW